MALIRCPDCETEHSDAAPACPKCGRPTGKAPSGLPLNATPLEFAGCLVPLIVVALLILFASLAWGRGAGVAMTQGLERALGRVEAIEGNFDISATDRGRVLLVGRSDQTIALEFSADSLRRWLNGPATERSLVWVLGWHGRLRGFDQLTVRSAILGKLGTTGTLQVERQLVSSGSVCYVWMWSSDSTRKMKIMTSASQMLRLRGDLLQASGATDSLTRR